MRVDAFMALQCLMNIDGKRVGLVPNVEISEVLHRELLSRYQDARKSTQHRTVLSLVEPRAL